MIGREKLLNIFVVSILQIESDDTETSGRVKVLAFCGKQTHSLTHGVYIGFLWKSHHLAGPQLLKCKHLLLCL